MNPAQKALWFIESHLADPLTLDEVAAVAGVSRFHLVRAFAAATGFSVMRYVRARRLSEAARALANGAPDILTVALDADYGSHEAFTRAFRDHFGGHSRSGSRLGASRPSPVSGADHHGFHRHR
jgi:AraC family transcriptional regulator